MTDGCCLSLRTRFSSYRTPFRCLDGLMKLARFV
nr:MAG TPA: hypothetical protein [Caudoviricetes sp.]